MEVNNMSISGSDYYRKIMALETTRQNGITALAKQGVVLSENASLPSIIGGIEAINKSSGSQVTNTFNITGSRIIYAAELPNVTFTLKDEFGDIVSSQTTPSTNGGIVAFTVTIDGVYTIVALNSNLEEIWTNTVTVNGVGQYKCYSSKSVNDYTWEELRTISANAYGGYMFKVDGQDYKQTNFMAKGATSQASRAYLVDVSDDGYLGFMFTRFNTTYKHHTSSSTNINGISWLGSTIRTNCLAVGDIQYIYDPTVKEGTAGDYYKYNTDTESFEQVLLPDDFSSTTKYYTRVVIETEGAVLTSLKEQLGLDSDGEQIMPRKIDVMTWGGYGAGITASSDTTIIKTQDYIFLPSDSQIFGHKNRSQSYSKYAHEGRQFVAFEEYRENNYRWSNSNSSWLRSPYASGSPNFCYWYYSGYVNYSYANAANYTPFCFYL